MTDFLNKRHPEMAIDGFTVSDGTVMFFSFIQSCCLKTNAQEVLDYGAGRGMFWSEDQSEYRRRLRDLRNTGARVTACDIDNAVLSHPCSDHQVLIEPKTTLPFEDGRFDVIVSENTFEHIEDAEHAASELYRVLKPGGYLCARTPNGTGYLRLLSSMVPNRLHTRVLSSVQPDRKAEDVFPTVYKMNTPSQIRKLFPEAQVSCAKTMGEPSYFFGNRLVYSGFKVLHRLLPSMFAPAISIFIHKPARSGA